MSVDIADGECVGSCGNAGDNEVVVRWEDAQKVRDEFFTIQSLADGRQCIGQLLDFLEVVSDTKIILLDGHELDAHLHDACPRAGCVHPLQRVPCFLGGDDINDVGQNILAEGGVYHIEHKLVLVVLICVLRIDDDGSPARALWVVGDGLARRCQGFVNVVVESLTVKIRKDLFSWVGLTLTIWLNADVDMELKTEVWLTEEVVDMVSIGSHCSDTIKPLL
jgi:hypothetical protein